MYEASVGIPLIMAGLTFRWPNARRQPQLSTFPQRRSRCSGLRPTPRRWTITSRACSDADDPDRTVFAEYHDGGWHWCLHGSMAHWKHIRYRPCRSFLIWADPPNWSISALTPRNAPLRRARTAPADLPASVTPTPSIPVVSPIEAKRIEALGGRNACRNAYLFNHTPTPDEQGAMERLDA